MSCRSEFHRRADLQKKILCSVWCVCVGGAVGMACGGCDLRWHLRTGTDIRRVVPDGCVGACGTW